MVKAGGKVEWAAALRADDALPLLVIVLQSCFPFLPGIQFHIPMVGGGRREVFERRSELWFGCRGSRRQIAIKVKVCGLAGP